jgi:glycosyltransferase involved in cell wall biosynthesis
MRLAIPKSHFGRSRAVMQAIKKEAKHMDWILIPAEKKNLPLFLFLLAFRQKNKSCKLISYNHPILKSNNGRITAIDKWLTKFFYRHLDRVVFYTKQSKDSAIAQGLISPEKAYYANNTLDNTEIKKHYQFALPNPNNFNILFIGRLIPNKRIPILLDYFQELKHLCPAKNINLDIIGDGPEAALVKQAAEKDTAIGWHGTLVDESDIAPLMSKANVVFIPGHSGLSINHAFLYGRPYITIQAETHAPEIHYLESGKNGLLLSGNKEQDLKTFVELIEQPEKVNSMAKEAYAKGKEVSIENWVAQMKKALTDA